VSHCFRPFTNAFPFAHCRIYCRLCTPYQPLQEGHQLCCATVSTTPRRSSAWPSTAIIPGIRSPEFEVVSSTAYLLTLCLLEAPEPPYQPLKVIYFALHQGYNHLSLKSSVSITEKLYPALPCLFADIVSIAGVCSLLCHCINHSTKVIRFPL